MHTHSPSPPPALTAAWQYSVVASFLPSAFVDHCQPFRSRHSFQHLFGLLKLLQTFVIELSLWEVFPTFCARVLLRTMMMMMLLSRWDKGTVSQSADGSSAHLIAALCPPAATSPRVEVVAACRLVIVVVCLSLSRYCGVREHGQRQQSHPSQPPDPPQLISAALSLILFAAVRSLRSSHSTPPHTHSPSPSPQLRALALPACTRGLVAAAMSRPASAASAGGATVRCDLCCQMVPSACLRSHSLQCFDDMASTYIAALPTVKSADVRAHTRAAIEASKRTAPAALVAMAPLPPLSQRRHADSRREREILIQRAAHLLDVAGAGDEEKDDDCAAVSVHLAGDALATLLHQRKRSNSDLLRFLCKRLRSMLDEPGHGNDSMQTKLHLVAALQLTLFAMEADGGAGGASSTRLTLQLSTLPGLSTHAWLFRFAEAYFLHMLENGAPVAGGAGQITKAAGWRLVARRLSSAMSGPPLGSSTFVRMLTRLLLSSWQHRRRSGTVLREQAGVLSDAVAPPLLPAIRRQAGGSRPACHRAICVSVSAEHFFCMRAKQYLAEVKRARSRCLAWSSVVVLRSAARLAPTSTRSCPAVFSLAVATSPPCMVPPTASACTRPSGR